MSDLVTLMEAYIETERYPNLVKFCATYEDSVKAYIRNFESADAAKRNLQKKIKLAFTNVHGKKKRGPGISINLELLFAEAKATAAIAATSWRTLAASVQRLGSTYVSEQDVANQTINDNCGGNESSGEDDDDSILDVENTDSSLTQFQKYKCASKASSEKHGFYVDGHLQEILSLSNVLFLKENEYSEEQVRHFGLSTLENIRVAMIDAFVNSNLKFDSNLYNQLSAVLRDFRPQDGTRTIKDKINDIAKQADDDDYRLIDILINCINKLPPFTRVDEEIGESELQGNYIDPIMYPLFHDPQENRYFRWLNKLVKNTDTLRPDGHLYRMVQREIDCSIGFVEVKPEKSGSAKRHEDMVRLVVFCKDAMEMQSIKAIISVQVVGFYISFYLFVSVDDLYYMVELYSFETAKYLSQLPHLLSTFDHLKQIMVCCRDNCVAVQEGRNRHRARSLDKSQLDRILNSKKPRSLLSSLTFRK